MSEEYSEIEKRTIAAFQMLERSSKDNNAQRGLDIFNRLHGFLNDPEVVPEESSFAEVMTAVAALFAHTVVHADEFSRWKGGSNLGPMLEIVQRIVGPVKSSLVVVGDDPRSDN
jgi:hypothetical protein